MLLLLSLKTYLRFLSVLRPLKYPLASDTNYRLAMIVSSSTFCEEIRSLNKTLGRFPRKTEKGAVSLFMKQPKNLKNESRSANRKDDSSYNLHISEDYFADFLNSIPEEVLQAIGILEIFSGRVFVTDARHISS